jgi:HD-like signal output (HDOD) protein
MLDTKISESKEKIKNHLSTIGNLPSVPHIITEVSQLLDNEKTSANDLCKIISQDQGIVTKILSVANSPLYGLPRRVSTIEFAVVIIGFEHIKNILVALSLVEAFKSGNSPNWNHMSYWTHSLLTATAAKRLADDLRYPKSGEVFTAGLLHDLGLVVLQRFMNKDFNNILKNVDVENKNYLKAEFDSLGFTHQDISEYLLEKWNFPPYIIEAVLNHHKPAMAEKGKILAAIIHLADYMTQKFQIGAFEWDTNFELDESVIDILGLGSPEYFEKFVNSYEDLFKSHLESLNV